MFAVPSGKTSLAVAGERLAQIVGQVSRRVIAEAVALVIRIAGGIRGILAAPAFPIRHVAPLVVLITMRIRAVNVHRELPPAAGFISDRGDFASRAAATAVSIFPRRRVGFPKLSD